MNIVYSIGGTPLTNRVQFLEEGGSFVTQAFRCEYASGGVRIDDPSGDLTIAGWQTFWVDDMDASPTRVWQGYIYDKTLGRGQLPPTGTQRVHDCELIDLNAALKFQVLHSNDAKRPTETDYERVIWLMSSEAITGYGNTLVIDAGLIAADDYPISFLAVDTRRSFANAVLRTLCEIAQKNAFVYVDDYTGLAALFYDKDESAVYESTIRISNVIADEDGLTTFYPSRDATLHQSGAERFGGVLFDWQGDPIYAQSASTIAAMDIVRDATISDDKQIGDAATAEIEALSFLNTHATEAHTIRVTILMPSASVNLLYAGQRMEVKFTHLDGYESFTWTRVRQRSVKPVGVDVQGTWTVLWQVDLELWVPPVPVDDAANEFTPVTCSYGSAGGGLTTEDVWGSYVNQITGDPVLGTSPDFTTFGTITGYTYGGPNQIDEWGINAFIPPTDEFLFDQVWLWDNTTAFWPCTVFIHTQFMSSALWSLCWSDNGTDYTDVAIFSDTVNGYLTVAESAGSHRWWGLHYYYARTVGGYYAGEGTFDGFLLWEGTLSSPPPPLPFVGDPVSETPLGSGTDYTTAGPFLPGTLRVLHDGTDQTAHIATSDPVAGTFTLDYTPSLGSTIRTYYTSA